MEAPNRLANTPRITASMNTACVAHKPIAIGPSPRRRGSENAKFVPPVEGK